MASSERWYFEIDYIHNTPSIRAGYDHDKELSCRQQAANFIQDMGQRLQVNQLCINTAIVYMHRFYMFHSFQRFHRTSLASAALFLAAKVEEQPRKLEHVIRFAQICLHRDQMPLDVTSQAYMEQVQDLIMNENILLQTLGFDVAIDHPHTHIVRCCQLVRASKDLAQTSYFMASYSLHLTTMCLQYKPTVVACFCIHLACKWSNWEIPESSEGKPWFWYVDKTVSSELLENLTAEFLNLFEKCPSRLKKKIMALSSYSNLPPCLANNPPGVQSQMPNIDNRLAIESHNPMNTVPHPIGPLGAAVAEANALNNSGLHGPSSGPHPFMHQNPMVNRHNNSEGMMKKHHYDNSQRPIPGATSLPPHPLEQPYKKLHHPPHHQRDSHNMGVSQNSAKLTSCMFDGGVVQPPPHKPYQHVGMVSSNVGHLNPPATHPCNMPNSRSNNHIPPAHRPPSRPHIRNGEAHFPDKKFPLDVKRDPVDCKPPQMLAPSPQIPPRIKPKTPPPHLNLSQPLDMIPPPMKVERSIFSPEEKSRVQEKIKTSPPPTPRTPVEVKKESPHSDVEQPPPPPAPPVVIPVPQDSTRPRDQASINTGDASRDRVAPSPPPPAPDTPSKSSHNKKKKKKHKEHKDKHKDKHKHKHRVKDPEPIVITIPKEKITISHPEGLKIKIAKEKISNPPSATTGLKLKISKDKLKESKKRERSEGEEEELEQPSKQHRPNGTTALQIGLDIGGRH